VWYSPMSYDHIDLPDSYLVEENDKHVGML